MCRPFFLMLLLIVSSIRHIFYQILSLPSLLCLSFPPPQRHTASWRYNDTINTLTRDGYTDDKNSKETLPQIICQRFLDARLNIYEACSSLTWYLGFFNNTLVSSPRWRICPSKWGLKYFTRLVLPRSRIWRLDTHGSHHLHNLWMHLVDNGHNAIALRLKWSAELMRLWLSVYAVIL